MGLSKEGAIVNLMNWNIDPAPVAGIVIAQSRQQATMVLRHRYELKKRNDPRESQVPLKFCGDQSAIVTKYQLRNLAGDPCDPVGVIRTKRRKDLK
jgi:hypothetical protein